MWLPAAEVARIAVAGLEQGKTVVIPGFANRVGAQFARHAPHQALAGVPGQPAPRPEEPSLREGHVTDRR